MQSNKLLKISKRYRFRGTVVNFEGGRVCIDQPTIVGSGKIFRDHVWVKWERGFDVPKICTEVEFSAQVKPYVRTFENNAKRYQLGLINCFVLKQED